MRAMLQWRSGFAHPTLAGLCLLSLLLAMTLAAAPARATALPSECVAPQYLDSFTSNCENAPAGTYVDQAGAYSPTDCPLGEYQDQPGQTECKDAPQGKYVDTTGAIQATPCEPGSYQDQQGQTSCKLADPGYYVPSQGAVEQTLCPAGMTSEQGAVECTPIAPIYTVSGFYAPVDLQPAVNVVKGGRTVPLKFEVFGDGVELTDTAVVSGFDVTLESCQSGLPTDTVEFTTTGGTSLRYDADAGQFIQNWKVPSAKGKCYAVTVTIEGGSTVSASFMTK